MKILIVNFMQIGDLVITTPVFHAIKHAHPDAFIAAAVNKSFSDLVKSNPFIDQLFEIDKSSWRTFFHSLKLIRAHHFDIAINLNRSERASALTAFSRAKLIIGYSKPFFSLFFDNVLPNLKRQMHQVYSHFKVLDAAGFHNLSNFGLEVFIPDNVLSDMRTFFRANFPDAASVIAFNVGASWTSKRWLPEYFAEVANALIERGFHIAFLGSKADLPIVNQCVSSVTPSERLHIFTGQFNLLQLAAFFDFCHLLITNDSGPLHIAVARNLPSVSVFGSSPVMGFYPFSNHHILVKTPVPCHPCYKHTCPLSNDSFMRCMKSVPPEVVLKYSLELISTFNRVAKDIPRINDDYECKVIDLAK